MFSSNWLAMLGFCDAGSLQRSNDKTKRKYTKLAIVDGKNIWFTDDTEVFYL